MMTDEQRVELYELLNQFRSSRLWELWSADFEEQKDVCYRGAALPDHLAGRALAVAAKLAEIQRHVAQASILKENLMEKLRADAADRELEEARRFKDQEEARTFPRYSHRETPTPAA